MRKIALLLCLVLSLSLLPQNSLAASPPSTPPAYQINGLDTHDGDLVQVGNTYYIYGTRYGCGFTWQNPNTMWCGFGTWSSTDMVHWTDRSLLFNPFGWDTWNNMSWQDTCRSTGCFNPRMVMRAADSKWILYFNAPGDFARTRANAYYAIGCDGPAGPCRDEIHKPDMYICYDNGDFAIVGADGGAYIVCTMENQSLNIEKLDHWWTNGVGVGGRNLTNSADVESPGVISHEGLLYLTYSEPNCGYCSSDGTRLVQATSVMGPYTNWQQASYGSCHGQPRTAVYLNGLAYEWIDQWVPGTFNQTNANIHLSPILFDGAGHVLPFIC